MPRLVSTANAPETEIACPARPSLTPRSCAMGVNRLTGMNSEATSAKAVIVIAKTPLQRACTGVSTACSEEGGQEELLMMMSGKMLPAAAS